MLAQHWQNFRASSSPRFEAVSLPIHAAEFERQRRKQEHLKSVFCCLKILAGKSPRLNNTAASAVRRRQSQMPILRANNTDDSFGYNFDAQPPSQQLSASSESSDFIVD